MGIPAGLIIIAGKPPFDLKGLPDIFFGETLLLFTEKVRCFPV